MDQDGDQDKDIDIDKGKQIQTPGIGLKPGEGQQWGNWLIKEPK
jgi:hypothetical protein